jgi:hypothetical protein
MRKHIILFFSALLILSACKSGNDSSGIIKQDDMIKLLADIHLADGYLATQPNNDSLYVYGTGQYQYIFKQHQTDSAAFKRSMKYYSRHDKDMVAIYEEVTKILQKKSDSVLAAIAREQEIAKKQGEKAQKALAQKEKLKQDSVKRKFENDLKLIKQDSVKKAKKDALKKAAAASKKALLKPKKLNTTKIK